MSVFELGECSRLAARISPEQCRKNRKGGVFACSGCVGLNNTRLVAYKPIEHDPAPLEPEVQPKIIIIDETINEEVLDMSSKPTPRGTCPVCQREDVQLPGPKCHRCYGRIKKGLDPVTGEPAGSVKPAAVEKPVPPPCCRENGSSAPPAVVGGGKYGVELHHRHSRTSGCRLGYPPGGMDTGAVRSRQYGQPASLRRRYDLGTGRTGVLI